MQYWGVYWDTVFWSFREIVRILPAELVSVLMSFFLFFLLLPLPSSSLPVSLLESFSVFRPAYLTYEEIS